MASGGLTRLEALFFGYAQSVSLRRVATGELIEPLGLAPAQETKLLSRLAARKLIARVRRGLYLVPARFPAGGIWSPTDAEALETLMADKRGRYQITGPNAFLRYGWDDQVPHQLFVYNNSISGRRAIGAVHLMMIKVADERLGGTETVKTAEGSRLIYSSKARAP